MDQLRNALQKAVTSTPGETPLQIKPPAEPTGVALLPDPLKSDWIALLRQLGGEIPKDPTMGQLTQRSDARARALADAGRGKDAAALKRAREEFQRDRAKRAWALVKERFEALELSDKTYRALKQEDADPERVLARLTSRSAEDLRGMGAARLREELMPRKG